MLGRISRIKFFLVFIISLTLGACSSEKTNLTVSNNSTSLPEPTTESITLTDGLGRSFSLDSPAERVISLAPSNTEILYAIGAGDQLVGRDTISDYPEKAAEVPDIGGGFGELNIETIISANPDLVLAADLTPPEQIQALENVGLKVYALPNPIDFEGLFANLETVAILTGHEEETAIIIDGLKSRVAQVEEIVTNANKHPLVFYELDSTDQNAPWTTGPGTFIDTLISMAGGENLGANLEGAWVQVSVEELISRDPDIIILGDFTWGGVTPDDVASRSGWDNLSAVQNSSVFKFDDNLVSRPGPRLVDGLEAMAELLHPELFD